MSRAALTLARAYIVNIIPTLPHHKEQHAMVMAALDAALADGDTVAQADAVAAERELCADLCEQMALYTGVDCASAIRSLRRPNARLTAPDTAHRSNDE